MKLPEFYFSPTSPLKNKVISKETNITGCFIWALVSEKLPTGEDVSNETSTVSDNNLFIIICKKTK